MVCADLTIFVLDGQISEVLPTKFGQGKSEKNNWSNEKNLQDLVNHPCFIISLLQLWSMPVDVEVEQFDAQYGTPMSTVLIPVCGDCETSLHAKRIEDLNLLHLPPECNV